MVKKDNRHHDNGDLLIENCIWLNTTEASAYLRTTPKQLRNWVYQGKIRFSKLFGRLRFNKTELDSLFNQKGDLNGCL